MPTFTGNSYIDVLLVIFAIVTAITGIAAAARQPPLKQIGHWIGWVFRQLIGEPVGAWFDTRFEQAIRPIVHEEVVASLKDHMEHEEVEMVAIHATTADTNVKVAALAETVATHIVEDRGGGVN